MLTPPRVVIDLNSSDEDGETIVFLSDVTSGHLEVGRMALAYEPDDGVAAPARVASIHPDRGVAFLQVDWRAMRREQPQSRTFRLTTDNWVTARKVNAAATADVSPVVRQTASGFRLRANAAG